MYKVGVLKEHLDRLVLVEWEDACGVDDWNDPTEAETVTIYTTGYLYFVSRNELKIARHKDAEGDYSGKHAIPAGMVRSVWLLDIGLEISDS